MRFMHGADLQRKKKKLNRRDDWPHTHKEHNGGLIGPGDWEKHSWKIQDDGWYEYKESGKVKAADNPAQMLEEL